MAFTVHLLHSLLLTLLLFTPSSHIESASLSLVTDREALISFRSKLSVDSPNPFSSWDKNTSPCDWTGVSCGTRNLRVISLNLSGLGFTGFISPSIGNLSFLTSLQLQRNRLYGPIPEEIANLFRLRNLNLSSNSLEGSLPSNTSKLVELKVLDLTSNKISGPIPVNIGYLTKLQVLSLGKNLLHGPLPPSMANLSLLTVLNLDTNSLNGPIPESLSRLRRLKVLDLSINNLTGTIPPSIYNMSSLVSLVLASNNLWGEFPGNVGYTLPNLLVFNMCFNKFSGRIPASLHNLTNIKVIRMAHNLLQGSIPPGLGRLPFLEMYNVGFNKIVWAGDNGLEDFIVSLTNSTRLNFLAFDGNDLDGVLPESIGNLSKDLSKLYMGGNRISGKIPASMAHLTGLALLNMSYNSLSGGIPQEIGNLQKLQKFEVAGNQLVGRIPDSLGNLVDLNDINLSQNNLEGPIPMSFGNFRGLLSMDLSSNRLNGSIPREIFNLPSLSTVLNLSKNVLSGPIPQAIGRLESLVSIDLSDNRLSGNIPQSIRGCNSLEKLNMARNQLTGPIPDTFIDVKGLESLDLSSNQLSGFIPLNLQDLHALRLLNLSFNNLEGMIPFFSSNLSVHLEGNPKLCLLTTCRKRRRHEKLLKTSIIVSATATLAVCVMIFLFLFSRNRKEKLVAPASPLKEPFINVSYDELRKATDTFSSENLIGAGSFGSVFKGIVRGAFVAVKVIDLKTNGYYKGFVAECETLRNVRHRNLVKLITSCSSLDFKNVEFLALVYEFLCNGSLDDWISGKRRKPDGNGLNVEERLNVAIDIASALDYLHNDCEIPVVHCDIKPSNVLLDEEMVAKVGDFGLARLLANAMTNMAPPQASISSTHVLKGSIGYIPPEYGIGEEPSKAGDVYSFGVMLLEIFSGKRPTHDSFAGDQNLIEWISSSSEDVVKVIDPQLVASSDDQTPTKLGTRIDCLKSVLEIGLACTSYAANERMAMREVLRRLKSTQFSLLKHI
ncbi:PREDICTED: putative receptor-like protein kinase At3g47110 [Tarenaya hassleriana]|uniref:putative receptor-like protein kinase At3g47110 n=1 Tax=Tarenaya hassleriana TaxID=28532 RepID=UPI00053C5E10|nr:PREDICTED: putative receptor-like protein kinase At3g47110 [Tarenaya hassleriana]